jgi:DNA-binding response OmpR family regulator
MTLTQTNGRDDAQPLTARPLPAADPPLRRTVLIVTGDRHLGAAATRVLQQEAYDVVTARHAGHAFLAALTQDRIDILISELTLDDMTGDSLAATLRRYHPRLQSVYISDRPVNQAHAVLVLPFTEDELLREVSSVAQLPTSSQAF